MPKKSETHEIKPEILKAEEVVVTPVVPVEVAPVVQMAQAVEPVITPVVEPVVEVKEERKPSVMWPLWIAIAFVLGAGAGFGLSKFDFDKKPVAKVAVPTVMPTAGPTKKVEKVFERSVIKVKVLNGSGIKGKAGVMAEKLENLGYVDVKTDNADRDDYTASEMSIKETLKVFEADIKKDVGFTGVSTTLAPDDAFDVLLIIGQK